MSGSHGQSFTSTEVVVLYSIGDSGKSTVVSSNSTQFILYMYYACGWLAGATWWLIAALQHDINRNRAHQIA